MSRIKVSAGIILRQSANQSWQVLIAKRPEGKPQGGLWEFPGGKVERGESAEQALIRELREEVNIFATKTIFFQQIDFDYVEKKITLLFFLVLEFSGKPQGIEGQLIQWVPLIDLNRYPFPPANQSIVNRLFKSKNLS